MKKKIIVILFLILLLGTLSSCSLISGFFNKKETFDLSTPENVSWKEKKNTLSWDVVSGATAYSVKIEYESGKPTYLNTENNSIYFTNVKPVDIKVSVQAVNTSKNQKSEYSEPISFFYYAPIELDEKTLVMNYSDGVLTVDWGKAEHASGYSLRYRVGYEESKTVELNDTHYEIFYDDTHLNCEVVIKAKGTGNYKDGRTISSTQYGIPDYDNPYRTITVDFNHSTDAVFPFEYVVKATLEGEDISFLDELGSKTFKIPVEYWEKMEMGVYNVALYGLYEVKTFKFVIINSKTPEITIGDYVKDGEDLVGELKAYGNTIKYVCGYYEQLSKYEAEVVGDKVIVYAYYLDRLEEGELKLNIAYQSPGSDEYKYLPFTVKITSKEATLNRFSYEYDGINDVEIDVSTNGDRVTTVYAGNMLVGTFTTYTNGFIIKKEFLDRGNFNYFTITTLKGATLSFIIHYTYKGFVPAEKIYTFDKNNGEDLHIAGAVKNAEITILGNKITSDAYAIRDNNLYIGSDYLRGLKGGVYEFAVFSEGVINTFEVKVFATNGNPQNFKLDYDTSVSETYIKFDCDCGNDNHYYTFGNGNVKCSSGDIVPNVNRTQAQTIKLTCETYKSTVTYSINPPKDAYKYLSESYTINGEEHDRYVESTKELADLLLYISVGGDGLVIDKDAPNGKSELTVYFSEEYIKHTKANPNYFAEANAMISTPYNCRFSLKGVGNVVTVTATFNYNPNEIYTSGKPKTPIKDNTEYLMKGNRPKDFKDFAISGYEKEEFITTIADLERLPFGYKPVFANMNDPAYKVYEKALSIARTYIRDDMNDVEKVLTFYHYLTTNVTYDTYALELYNLRANIANQNLTVAKDIITKALYNNGKLDRILSPLLDLNSLEEIITKLSNSISRLSSFNVYGCLVENVSVCDGIASAFKLLCSIEGIECIEVSGIGVTSRGSENHAWNKVKIDGKWYIVDATWGRNSDYVNHRYFLIDEFDAMATHIESPDSVFNSVVEIPATGEFDYFVWNIEPYSNHPMIVTNQSELKTLVQTLKKNGEMQFEIKLDFEFDSIADVIKSLNTSCSYYVFDNIVLIVLKY